MNVYCIRTVNGKGKGTYVLTKHKGILVWRLVDKLGLHREDTLLPKVERKYYEEIIEGQYVWFMNFYPRDLE